MSSVTELDTLAGNLEDYFDLLQTNLETPSQPLPSFEDYIGNLIYDDLLTDAQAGSVRGPSFSIGAAVDAAHLVAAIQREFAMRSKSKIAYFADGQDDVGKLLDYIDYMHGSYTGYMNGITPQQRQE